MIEPLKIQIRFSDCDMMGHVNNACYLNYFELARLHYFGQLLDKKWDWQKQGIILKKNEVEYIKPLYLADEPLIYLFLEHIGTTSFTLAYELHVEGKVRTKGSSVIVCYDFSMGETVAVYADLKTALEKLKK